MPATLRGGFSRKTMLYLMWLTFQEAKLIYNPSPLKILTAEIILRPGLIIYRQLSGNFLSSGKPVWLSFQLNWLKKVFRSIYEHFFLIPSDANTSPDELQKTYPREEQN